MAADALPDLAALKARQQDVWASGNYAAIGSTLQIVGERLCEAVDLRAGWQVLDVAAGNGNATLAAARCGCEVTSTDYVPALLENGRERAIANQLAVDFRQADAEALPFEEGSFDAVLSTFGVMFTPDQRRAAAELLRVCRVGGRIGLANWTPDGFVGEMFRVMGRHVPPPPNIQSPLAWGSVGHLEGLFGGRATIVARERHFTFRYRSPEHFVAVFRDYYGPVQRAFQALDAGGQEALAAELVALAAAHDRAGGGTLVVPGAYLEVVATRQH